MTDNGANHPDDKPEKLTTIERLAVNIKEAACSLYGTELKEGSPGSFSTAQTDEHKSPIIEQHSSTPVSGLLHHRIWVGSGAVPLSDVDHVWAHCSYDPSTGAIAEAEVGWTNDNAGEHMVSILIAKYPALVPSLDSYLHMHTKISPPDDKGWSMVVACRQELVERFMREHGDMGVQSAVDQILSNAPEHMQRMLDTLGSLRVGVFDDSQPT